MKRIALTVISVCLVLASVFGFIAAGSGMDDITDILRQSNLRNDDIRDSIALISDRYAEIKEKGGDDTAKSYATAVVTDKYGSSKISAGQKQYDEGKAQLDKGQKEYDAAKAKLDKGKADYAAAEKLIAEKEKEIADGEKQIADGEKQLAAAKQKRDEGQALLDEITPIYNKAKPYYDKLHGTTGGNYTEAGLNILLRSLGYNKTITDLFNEYDAAKQQLADADKQIADAEAQLEEGKQQIADGKEQLAAGKKQLADAKQQLDNGDAQLAAGKAKLDDGKAQLANAEAQLAAGKRKMANNSVTMANDLENLEEMDGAQDIVDEGIKILLANEGIAEKVTDRENYDEVLAAASEFVEQEADNVQAELTTRQQLYSLLTIICIICVVAGVVGGVAAFLPKYPTLIAALVLNSASALGSAALNIFGYVKGYRYFVYSLNEGGGDGSLQFGAMIAILIVSLLAAVITLSCVKSYKSGIAVPVKAAAGAAPKAAKPAKPAKQEKPARVKKSDEDDDDEGWSSASAAQPAPETQVIKPEPTAAPDEPTVVDDGSIPADLVARMQAQTKRLNEEVRRMEEESRQQDFEAARREYEEALRKFEEARKKSN